MFIHFVGGAIDVITSAIYSNVFLGLTATSRCVDVVLAKGVFQSVCRGGNCRDYLLDQAARSSIAIASMLVP